MSTFEERFNYLKLHCKVGIDTFGSERYLNQKFYQSSEWRRVRNEVILRDKACDLGVPGHDICDRIYIHHINPIGVDDIENATEFLLNPENLICVSFDTHNALHYGDSSYLNKNKLIERGPNDTCPWKH